MLAILTQDHDTGIHGRVNVGYLTRGHDTGIHGRVNVGYLTRDHDTGIHGRVNVGYLTRDRDTGMVLSACVAAVKCRPVLHHCVVIFFWSSGIIDCLFVYI